MNDEQMLHAQASSRNASSKNNTRRLIIIILSIPVLCCCAYNLIVSSSLLGPAFSNVFSNIIEFKRNEAVYTPQSKTVVQPTSRPLTLLATQPSPTSIPKPSPTENWAAVNCNRAAEYTSKGFIGEQRWRWRCIYGIVSGVFERKIDVIASDQTLYYAVLRFTDASLQLWIPGALTPKEESLIGSCIVMEGYVEILWGHPTIILDDHNEKYGLCP